MWPPSGGHMIVGWNKVLDTHSIVAAAGRKIPVKPSLCEPLDGRGWRRQISDRFPMRIPLRQYSQASMLSAFGPSTASTNPRGR
jgi:hypothetical protein